MIAMKKWFGLELLVGLVFITGGCVGQVPTLRRNRKNKENMNIHTMEEK